MNMGVLISIICSSILAIDAVSIKQRVLGGHPTTIFEYPHQAVLFIDGLPKSGATLITKKELLTGAIRVYEVIDKKPTESRAFIRLGTNDIRTGELHDVRRISRHPGFKIEDGICYNDIAVVHLLTALVGDYLAIQPIKRADATSRVPGGTNVYISGFDRKKENGREEIYLTHINTTTIDQSECKRRIPWFVTAGSEIFIIRKVHQGCIVGDAGNGMVDSTKSVLLGIFSHTRTGSTPDEIVNIFTEVAAHHDYIEDEIAYFASNRSTRDDPPAVNFPWFTQQLF